MQTIERDFELHSRIFNWIGERKKWQERLHAIKLCAVIVCLETLNYAIAYGRGRSIA